MSNFDVFQQLSFHVLQRVWHWSPILSVVLCMARLHRFACYWVGFISKLWCSNQIMMKSLKFYAVSIFVIPMAKYVEFLFCIQAVLCHASLNFVYMLPIGAQLPQKCSFCDLVKIFLRFSTPNVYNVQVSNCYVIILGLLCCTWCLTDVNEIHIMFSVFIYGYCTWVKKKKKSLLQL